MKSTASKRLGSITVLSLLALLAIAIGAQAALTASSSSTPAAGTQGRGGADASVTIVAVTTPAAGTEGRGGVAPAPSAALASANPASGTRGRGGAPLVTDRATQVLENTVANDGFILLAKDGVPRPVTGGASTTFKTWVAVGIAIGVLLVALAAWASSRRRSPVGEESTAAFCAQHPEDALCMVA